VPPSAKSNDAASVPDIVIVISSASTSVKMMSATDVPNAELSGTV